MNQGELSYRGEHEAPTRDDGAPMHDLTGTYPEDFYGPDGVRYYGDGSSSGAASVQVVQGARGRPRKPIKVYRAVPYVPTRNERICDIEKQKAYMLRYGRYPPEAPVVWHGKPSAYYDVLWAELEQLRQAPDVPVPAFGINVGDWVTINRAYAKEHGEACLRGQYRILSKTVPAGHLYTDGNSIYEWGYDPTQG